jgi:hypothetical protein
MIQNNGFLHTGRLSDMKYPNRSEVRTTKLPLFMKLVQSTLSHTARKTMPITALLMSM